MTPSIDSCWAMIERDPIDKLDLEKAVCHTAWLIASSTSPPYQYYRDRIDDRNGNKMDESLIVEVLNYVPALLLEIKACKEKIAWLEVTRDPALSGL